MKIRIPAALLVLCASSLAIGCGGADSTSDGGNNTDGGTLTDGGSDAGTTGGCVLTYGGVFHATVPCTVSATHNSNGSPQSNNIYITYDSQASASGADSANFSSGGASLTYQGTAFTTGTFAFVDPNPNNIMSLATLQTKDHSNWEEGSPTSGGQVGTFSYTITNIGIGTANTAAGFTTYTGVHGSFTGTLPALGTLADGGTGDATLSIGF